MRLPQPPSPASARAEILPGVWLDARLKRRLRASIADHAPAAMLWLGDIIHAAPGGAAAERFLREPSVPVTLLAGNHDRRWPGVSANRLILPAFSPWAAGTPWNDRLSSADTL